MIDTKKRILRPSSIIGALNCPARWYLDFLAQDEPSKHPSAALVGTSVHKAAETYWRLCIAMKEKIPFDFQQLEFAAIKEFQIIEATDGVNWAQDHSMTQAIEQIKLGVKMYGEQIVPNVDVPLGVELRIEKPIDHPVISHIAGTIDAVYPDHIVDIKCRMGNRKKNTAEFTLQQTVYVMLARFAGHDIRESRIHQLLLKSGVVHNEDCFINMPRVEYVISNLLERLEAVHNGLSPDIAFSGNSNYFLCSGKWCDYWNGCKFARGKGVIEIKPISNVGDTTGGSFSAESFNQSDNKGGISNV